MISDLALLDALTAPTPPIKTNFRRRDEELDPLLLAAAATSGPNATRNHYQHDFFPGVSLPIAEGAWDWSKWDGDQKQGKRLVYASRQAPRSQRLRDNKENNGASPRSPVDPLHSVDNVQLPRSRVDSVSASNAAALTPLLPPSSSVEVKCMARTRIPTPHGLAFLHLYHNNRDHKEHLAIVVDPAQFSEDQSPLSAPSIRSSSLDAVWSETETEMDRLTRGAYIGRLSPATHKVSSPASPTPNANDRIPSPLIRIHSECFTGETIGSMRCDCGEQLDEAIRLMSRPITVPSSSPTEPPLRLPGRGVVIYMRQEGRGIGLLSKIRAYNLQDLGHDTVTANLMLGHQADERGYEVAIAILRDLGLGSEAGEGVRLLTNNPDKVRAMEREGLRIVERVPMVPRSWQKKHRHSEPRIFDGEDAGDLLERKAGATMIGGDAVHGEDLEKYLRTKVLRMGHMLSLHTS
ncbi:GTP cyclohydrolase II-domain-containing protein [Amylostereum chailletii]|nr:GTP cyclohydrolase II-domain-containing protein [Amylostereum chailletii]